jgi:hypothetical protein
LSTLCPALLEFKWIDPSGKLFLVQVGKDTIDHHFVMSFSLRECILRQNRKNVYPGNNAMRLLGEVYYTKNYKKTDFTNLGYHITVRNDDKLTSGKSQF